MKRRFIVRLNGNRGTLFESAHRSPWSAWQIAKNIRNDWKYPGVPERLDFRRHTLVLVDTQEHKFYDIEGFRAEFCRGHDRNAWKRKEGKW